MNREYPKYNSYNELLKDLNNDALIKQYLANLRWTDSPKCIHCQKPDFIRTYSKPGFYECSSCNAQFSVLQGTIFERSHIPLDTWLWALFEFSLKTLTSKIAAERFNIEQRTAWKMIMKIRQCLWQELENKLCGKIYCDEKELGANPQKDLRVFYNKNKRQDKGLTPNHFMKVFGMIEDGKAQKATKKKMAIPGGKLLLFAVDDISINTLQTKMVMNTDSFNSDFITDGWLGYSKFDYWCNRHFILNKKKFGLYDFKKYVRNINPLTMELANNEELRKGEFMRLHNNPIENVWRHLQQQYEDYFGYSKEYAQMYFNEFMFRWNHLHLTMGEKFDILLKRALNTPLYEGKGKNRKKIVLDSKFTLEKTLPLDLPPREKGNGSR